MSEFRMRCEVNVQMPETDRYGEIVAHWIDAGSAAVAGSYRAAIEAGPPLDATSVRRSGPAGPPHSVWGFVAVTRLGKRGEFRQPGRVYSVKNLQWLRDQLADPAVLVLSAPACSLRIGTPMRGIERPGTRRFRSR